MTSLSSKNYRWIGLTGVILILLSNWADFVTGFVFIDPLARLLLLVFSIYYWKEHRDRFSVILLVCAAIFFALAIANITSTYITPSPV